MQASLSRLLLLRHLHARFTARNEQTESLSFSEWRTEFCWTLQIPFWSTRSTSPALDQAFLVTWPHAIIRRCSLDAVLARLVAFLLQPNLLKYGHTICSSKSSAYQLDKWSVLWTQFFFFSTWKPCVRSFELMHWRHYECSDLRNWFEASFCTLACRVLGVNL